LAMTAARRLTTFRLTILCTLLALAAAAGWASTGTATARSTPVRLLV
jgi:hypothetical protein